MVQRASQRAGDRTLKSGSDLGRWGQTEKGLQVRNSLGEVRQTEAQRHGHEEPITSLHSARHVHPCPPPIQPAEHSAEEARRGRGAENGSAQSTEHERAPLPLEEGPGRGSGFAWKLPVTSRHGGSFAGGPALVEEENQSGQADIPSPWTEPRALFPSGAQPRLWLCPKTLARAQAAGCSHSKLDLLPSTAARGPGKCPKSGQNCPLSIQHRIHWVPSW